MADEIELADYDPGWPQLFLQERERLERALPADQILAIEHAGSTAIPGLAAKPIIDIFIAVASVEEARRTFVTPMLALGYAYWEDNPDTARMFFVRGMPPYGERRTHHVHVMEPDCAAWQRSLLLRDHLRNDPAEAHRYGALKRDLATHHRHDREAYTRGKDSYIAGVVALATRQNTSHSEETP